MGAGSTKFGVPTNPRVELADSQTKHAGKRMEIDTPSIIKLDHGTIRYREPEDHRKPVLPRLVKPAEAPHEGKDRVGKCGYFYHPKLTDFSRDGRYTKEDASRFHYVQKTPASSGGKKVFFVMGVGMPDELEAPKKLEEISREVTITDLDGENVNESEPKMEDNNKENVVEATNEVKDDSEKKEENAENVNSENKPEDDSPEDQKESETTPSEPEKSESSSKPEETRDYKKDNSSGEKIELNKEFRGPLIPRVNIPQINELPVKPDRTPIICRVRNQIYYNLVFSAPVIVNPELATSRTNLFLGSKPDVKNDESQEENKEGETSDEAKVEEAEGGEVPKENMAKHKDEFSIDVLAESNPPTLGVEFERTMTTAQLKKRLGDKLEIQPTRINLLHEDKYITSQRQIADFYVGEIQEGYRHRIVLSPM